ncbi:hypothetical protein [Gulosibacter bifidus]|uniref:SAF domain-containing protein n=1 Tax=Gulosibacter bifidus TaxID=272239 RepID=A0ABW5RJT7_9MICO|nr:hypothetical protein [Gulosibacter bifidus]
MTTTVRVYVTDGAVAPGERIAPTQLREVEMNLSGGQTQYLRPDAHRDRSDLIATRPIGAGELVPLSALGEQDDSMAAVVLRIDGSVSATITTGSEVQVWAATPGERPGTFAAPEIIVANATVVRTVEQEDFVIRNDLEIEVLVPDTEVATVLAAMANDSKIQLVPVHAPVSETPNPPAPPAEQVGASQPDVPANAGTTTP